MATTTLSSRWRIRADRQHNLDVEAHAHTLKARDHTGYREAARSKPVGDGYDEEPLLTVEGSRGDPEGAGEVSVRPPDQEGSHWSAPTPMATRGRERIR